MTFSDDMNKMHDDQVTAAVNAALEEANAHISDLEDEVAGLEQGAIDAAAERERLSEALAAEQARTAELEQALADCQNAHPDPQPPTPEPVHMWAGSSIPGNGGLTLAQKRTQGMDAFRVFYEPGAGLPKDRKSDPQTADVKDGEVWIISYKDDVPEATVAAYVASWPGTVTLIMAWHHEPENDGDAATWGKQFRTTLTKQAGYITRAGAVPAVCLMAYTLNPKSGRKFSDWYVPEVAIVLFDAYNVGSDKGIYTEAAKITDPCAAAAASVSKPWGIAETGSPDLGTVNGMTRAAWAASLAADAAAKGASVLTWWDQKGKAAASPDYRLDTATAKALVVGAQA